MAKSKSYTIFVALLFCFLISSTDACAPAAAPSPIESGSEGGEENLCEKMSITWSGQCFISGNCNDQCKNLEGAVYGACHWNGLAGFSCYCYFNC
ncbi:PREDICTED: defensin-like protein 1 [Ipomoea nil]|uniref:defensin-like protein 1 n=1 Tax=Ipomoea nil TaxID=35883 RepID=UPI0009017FC6|nr:PREDICTED: defensin-like protein 1 [Ipomoea nil]